MKDTLTGVVSRVNTNSSGNQATGGSSSSASFSADSRYVAFTSDATNLITGDTNGFTDVFVKDTLTGTTTRINTDSAGNQTTTGNSAFYSAGISGDGRYVVFSSVASDLVSDDSNVKRDIFRKDLTTGIIIRVSTDSAGRQAVGASILGRISVDGRYVAFSSDANNLVTGDANGENDVFIKDTLTGTTTRVNTDSSGNEATGGYSFLEAVSADGRYVVFRSAATNLVAGDSNGTTDVFMKDTLTGITTRINTDSSGNQATGGISAAFGISADGRYVAFTSDATNLVGGDTNGVRDVFVKDTATGITTRMSTDSAGNQSTGGSSRGGELSADGRYLAFYSGATNLVGGDTNGQSDVFLRDLTKTGLQQLAGLVVSNQASAGVTLTLTARARTELAEYRAALGSSLNRVQSFMSTLSAATISNKEAAARIQDADIAEEASKMLAARIRQEITADLLRRSNLEASYALYLLKG